MLSDKYPAPGCRYDHRVVPLEGLREVIPSALRTIGPPDPPTMSMTLTNSTFQAASLLSDFGIEGVSMLSGSAVVCDSGRSKVGAAAKPVKSNVGRMAVQR